jgi:ATP-dependent exoDNAse (exonuclease V) beta subunit
LDYLKRALNCDRSVFIQACAGAGKTFALTKRYAAILDRFAQEAANGANPEQIDHKKILVITFTKKATGEMNERIYKDVNVLLSGHELEDIRDQVDDFCPNLRTNVNPAVQKYTQKLKDTFSQNSISTIDSFCSRILREFAHKVDLDPQFTSQDDAESKKLLDENLEKWLKQKVADDPQNFDILLEDMSFYHIRQAIKNLYHSREVLDAYTDNIESKSIEEIWQDWLIRYTPNADIEMLVIAFENLWRDARENCKDQTDALYVLLKNMHDDFEKIRSIRSPLEFRAAFLSEVVNRKKGFIKDNGEYRKDPPGSKGNWKKGKDLAIDWFDLLQTIDPKEIKQTPGPGDKKIIPFLKTLIALYRDFNDYYFEIKKQRNVLDFSDVIIKTHELLSDDAGICKQIAKRYRHIMLDEFQDTNPLRWDIIRMIFKFADNAKLFIVGDRKQSIFRFTNADVTVMNDAEALVREEKGEILDFNDNYRSSEEFVEKGINELIKKIMPSGDDEKEAYEASFEPTEAKTNTENILPAIEAHWCSELNVNSDDYLPALHAAKQVKRLLDKYENSTIDPKDGGPLIGVILRRFTKISDYLQAFRKLDIPISIIGGKGFYETPAVRDIFHFLSVLDNPYDDQALIGLLRSPFIALSDPAIHKLSKRDKKTPLFEVMKDHASLHEARNLIETWIQAAGTVPLDELIAQILDNEDRELGYVSELMPEQQLANLDKAINVIRGMQRSGKSLRTIREFFFFQMSKLSDEAQAIYPGTAKVHLLTVHKAKGLEYPIVVLPEMNHGGKSTNNNIRFGRTGENAEIALSLSDKDKPGLLLRLKEIANNEEEAEDKRVFYVALTRAIHKICFLAEEKDKAGEKTWWNKYVLQPRELKLKEPENWPAEEIQQHLAENMALSDRQSDIETKDWITAPEFESTGSYLYRTPHDLMGESEEFEIPIAKEGLGTAPGSLYHYCVEQTWFDVNTYKNEIDDYIQDHFSDVDKDKLIAKVDALLLTTREHSIYNILNDPAVEQYRELKVKAWLGKDRDLVQVNGTIDLLYQKDGQWVIVDFKTDSSKRQLNAYKKQIQSYQWMLKQVYNIDVQGKIFFVSLNEIADVVWDNTYFDELPIGGGYSPVLPESNFDVNALVKKISEGDHILFCVSAHHEEQIYLGLVKIGCMRPDIMITTLSKWVRSSNAVYTSQDRLRLMIQRSDENMKQGTTDFLAKAIKDHEMQKGEIRSEFKKEYRNILSDKNYKAANIPYMNAQAGDQRIGFVNLPPLAPLELELVAKLRSKTECFDCSLISGKEKSGVRYIEAFSPREEVLAVAQHIKNNLKPDDDILITVSSMEKYAPHLQRIFPQLGLQVRFIGPKSLLESPCISLLLDVMKVCKMSNPDWQDLAPILLHPLCKADHELLIHDKIVRSHPLDEHKLPFSAREFLKDYQCRNVKQLKDKIDLFIKDLDINADPEIKICAKFVDILDELIKDLNLIYHEFDLSRVYQEMLVRIKKESIPRRDQANGIPVLGFLDSLGSVPDKLYIMGMVEGDIPRPENENPCFNLKEPFSLELNRHFMKYWRSLGDRVIYSFSQHAEDGSDQNRSSFLEGLSLKSIFAEKGIRRDILLQYDNCLINEANKPIKNRHNEFISTEKGKYSGWVDETVKDFDLAVSSIDTLLACPMKFYYDKRLKVTSMDEDEGLHWILKRGNVVHKILEHFGEEGGFVLNLNAAVKLLEKNIQNTFIEEKIDPDDPFQMDRFRNYIRELNENSESNCLIKILRENQKEFKDYEHIETEKTFDDLELSYGDIKVNLKGRIDKLMIDEQGKRLVASDYKTGTIKTNRLAKMMLSQLYLYQKKCKEDYPDHELMAIYEQVKDWDNTKIIKYLDEDGEFKQHKSKNYFNIEKFEQYLADLFNQISAGKYYITGRPYKDACENCSHAGLCRKDSRLKIKEN